MKLFLTNIYRLGRYHLRSLFGRARLLLNQRVLAEDKGDWVIVLSLGRNGSAPNVTKELWNRGYRVHVLCPEFPARERNHIHSWQKVLGLHDISTVRDFHGLISSLEARKPIGVLLETKNLLLPAQVRIAEELGLKSLGDKAVETSDSKIAMREALDTLEGRQLPWQEVTDLATVTFDLPAVIKPDRGTSSKGVLLIQTQEDLVLAAETNAELLSDISVGERRLMEGFVTGRQFDLSGLAQDGNYVFYALTEEYYEGRPPYFPPGWHYLNPPVSPDLQLALKDSATRSLQALGVHHGSFHMEMRIDTEGHVFALDYANRLGGNNAVISEASGTSFPGGYVDSMLGRVKLRDIKFNRRPVISVFCQDIATLEMARKFFQKYPDNVLRFSRATYQIGHTQFQGRINVTDSDDISLCRKLSSVGGLPEQFAQLYPDLTASVANL